MAKRDYYDVLGLARGASEQDIKSAFRRLAKDCHPDRNSGDHTAEHRFKELNEANLAFIRDLNEGKKKDESSQAFFVSDSGVKDFTPSITSFLCTDTALDIFKRGGAALDTMNLIFRDRRQPNEPDRLEVLTNEQCLKEAHEFYKYADIEGYRGSPHKL